MKPQLPPRLPPRQNENPDAYTPAPPPPYSERPQDEAPQAGRLNQEAVNRLGQAGISVPGLDIGRRTTISPPVPPRRTAPQSAQTPTPPLSPANGALHQAPPLGELQSRFAKMKTPSADSPTTGTSWAEKKAALNTMHSFRNDPSKVSVSDMKAAASTANNFRERHGEQTTGGWRAANDMQQRYGGTQSASSPTSASPPLPSPSVPGLGKKAPPPPPPKRKELSFGQNNKPPPVPLGSKPRF
ncbi:hypothetical protein M011DRAFT_311975 [Sporormia fimetaria CBS 119925]|uniref:Uncharacterized protein n=1 Tax=Sporormia fimetaria CBS 119925 TaxID=1340428 RepID=A0A6A6VJ44_9PLEO|nr:hypothetical protein M011DRAFT_311975 [Sporormia fimetaria CBS 119925]